MVHISTSTVPRRRRERTDRIVEAALVRLARDGFDGLTMSALAGDLGYAVGALYRYFPSKDALLLGVQSHVVAALAADLAGAEAVVEAHATRSRSLTPGDVSLLHLLALAEVYRSLGERRPAHAGLLGTLLGDPRVLVAPEEAAQLVPPLVALLDSVTACFAAAADTGVLDRGDARRRAVVFWAALQGLMQLRKLSRFEVAALDPDGLAAPMVGTLLRGWGADERRLDAMERRVGRLTGELGGRS